jgi:hypothetical protein
MIVDHRTYNLVVGGVPKYFELYEQYGREAQLRILPRLLGYYTTEVGQLHQVVHLWGYDSFEQRAERRKALFADENFRLFVEKSAPLIVSQENKLLIPTAFSPA